MAIEIKQNSFLFGANSAFIEELYQRYLAEPNSVDPDWARFFAGLNEDAGEVLKELRGASWSPKGTRVITNGENGVEPFADGTPPPVAGTLAGAGNEEIRAATLDSLRALMLIRAYRVRGHLLADLDPLGLEERPPHPELEPATYGFTEADYDREIFINYVLGLETATLRQILEVVKQTYCARVGVEFMHIQEPDEKAWIQERVESTRNAPEFSSDEKKMIYRNLVEAEGFEQFLQVKHTGTKRFGLDGAEATITALEEIIHSARRLGAEEIVLGMPHRGRLNVLANIMHKPYAAIFSEFQGNPANPEDVQGSGDVKYHLGTSADREFEGSTLHLSLNPNPSHLEAVDPVVVGKVRAKQAQRGDSERIKVLGLLMHGDASFAGQGLVAETFDFSGLRGYRTGGTVHLIVNNQIGFTTSPNYSRSSPYPSDVAKMVQAPIFHVNGDDPEAVVHVARTAIEYRQLFRKDVVIDMFCYRRFGHNEGDEPSFTQPLMYRKIKDHPTTREIYARRLAAEGVLGEDEAEEIRNDFRRRLEQEFEASKSYKPNKADWLEGVWTGFEVASGDVRRGETVVDEEVLNEIGRVLSQRPENLKIHSRIGRLLDAKRRMFETGEGFDWATAEALAFGTLLVEGTRVRFSGQDSARGTFSQRHAVLVDQETEERFVPLNHLRRDQAPFDIIDSPLSEASVLGFEYGYSTAEPNVLVLWEAQFGDFANGAQVIIDQFIASGESKWLRMSGLVMLLPHGFEGQGPEHSSGRVERYLQLCGEDNMQVVNCTTPANYFHVLRRQMRRKFRKPLIVMTPKSLLRHKRCVSKLSEMGSGSSFHRALWDDAQLSGELRSDIGIKRVVLCTGKVYYDLFQGRAEAGVNDIYFLRLEQLYPFPRKALMEELGRFPQAEMVWCQEEPKNMGAWSFVEPRIEEVLGEIGAEHGRARYVGRAEAASPATGLLRDHNRQQAEIIEAALKLA
jgi:2-oxoglutarate dehydrogenase E1 component